MQGQDTWSYRPYRPFFYEVGDIYVCRMAPYADRVRLEWLPTDDAEYTVLYRERGKGEFAQFETTSSCGSTVTGLKDQTDYEFLVKAGDKKSRVRLARTGEPVGNIINYLHPDDLAYNFSGRYLCSPSLVRHPDGYLLASMDLFDYGGPQNLTLIFRSDDDGETWSYVSELMPCFWGKMFIHKGELYMLGCSTEYGDLLIGKSTDGGVTFSSPVTLLRGAGGKKGHAGIHKNPQNVVVHNGRIYETLEWGSWNRPPEKNYMHAAMVMSCAVDDDLLDPKSWHFTPPVKYDPNWEGTVDGPSSGNIEGTLCVAPDGNLYNVMRYCIGNGATPAYGRVLAYRVDTADPDAPLTYSHAIEMPCNESKFMIKFDEVSKKYYSVATRIDRIERRCRRNLLSLLVSEDMEHWTVACDLIDKRDCEMEIVGFQYCDFYFEGDDIIYQCRTAWNRAHNYHDSNYATFHRVKNFRDLT